MQSLPNGEGHPELNPPDENAPGAQDRPTRELRCCGTASPCGAGIVLRRKLLLQRQKRTFLGIGRLAARPIMLPRGVSCATSATSHGSARARERSPRSRPPHLDRVPPSTRRRRRERDQTI